MSNALEQALAAVRGNKVHHVDANTISEINSHNTYERMKLINPLLVKAGDIVIVRRPSHVAEGYYSIIWRALNCNQQDHYHIDAQIATVIFHPAQPHAYAMRVLVEREHPEVTHTPRSIH